MRIYIFLIKNVKMIFAIELKKYVAIISIGVLVKLANGKNYI